MNLFEIQADRTLSVIEPQLFNDESIRLKERQDLQAMLRDSPEAQRQILGEGLLVFSEEFSNWQDSVRRIDLLALDKRGELVVIELKRDEDGAHMELQAVRYAAMVSAMTFQAVLRAYQAFLIKRGLPGEEAEPKLLEFLGKSSEDEVAIGSKPRILLLSRGLGKEITTTVLWLRNECNLDVRCIEMIPHEVGGRKLLATQTIIPPPAAADYMVTIGEKTRQTREAGLRTRAKPVVQELVRLGRLTEGSKVVMIRPPITGDHLNIEMRPEQKAAVFLSGNKFRWEFDGSTQTLTGICKEIFRSQTGLEKPFAGPSYFAFEGENESLNSVYEQLVSTAGSDAEESENSTGE
jgi:hypothetical protein